MTGSGWTFDELLTNGWYPHWEPVGSGERPYAVTFTYYRSEITVDSVYGTGATEAEAIAEAERNANAWLQENPQFKPRR
jgi:hypothetical protein